jgi:hypothetical protein
MLSMMDAEEVAYQLALDRIETDEVAAYRAGVPTLSETMAIPSSRRIGRRDPDWFKKLEAAAGR